ncbi:FlgD immunoglobulin-like domain containing protein, partial [Candidatus Neomarinimicrobiota bacterium]
PNFQLLSNYPNPFNPYTIIRYDLPKRTPVTLAVYDQLGQEVVVLRNGDLQANQHESIWDGRDANGRSVPSGIYIARLATPEYSKMLLLK